MDEGEALRNGKKAVKDAQKRVGANKKTLLKEIEKQTERDPELMKAFETAGHLILESMQESKH
jgi:hypothetical protein